MIALGAVCVVVASWFAGAVVRAQPLRERMTVAHAAQLAESGDFEAAGRVLDTVTRTATDPREVMTAWGMLGDLRLMRDDIDGAVAAYDRIIASMPGAAYAHYQKGVALSRRLGDQESAIRSLEEAVQLGCDEVDLAARLGFCYKNLGDQQPQGSQREKHYQRAEACYEQAKARQPDEPMVLGNLADIQFNRGRYHDALAAYENLAKLMPGSAFVMTRLANAQIKTGQATAAVVLLRQVLAQPLPTATGSADRFQAVMQAEARAFACSLLAEACLRLGRAPEAMAAIDELESLVRSDRIPAGYSSARIQDLRESIPLLRGMATAVGLGSGPAAVASGPASRPPAIPKAGSR